MLAYKYQVEIRNGYEEDRLRMAYKRKYPNVYVSNSLNWKEYPYYIFNEQHLSCNSVYEPDCGELLTLDEAITMLTQEKYYVETKNKTEYDLITQAWNNLGNPKFNGTYADGRRFLGDATQNDSRLTHRSEPHPNNTQVSVGEFIDILLDRKRQSWQIGCQTFRWQGEELVSDDVTIAKELVEDIYNNRPRT